MNKTIYVCIVLVPLVIALGFLIFSLSTEWWTTIDYNRVKPLNRNLSLIDNSKYQIKRVKFEFPKYTSLFGECDEFKSIDIILPIESKHETNPYVEEKSLKSLSDYLDSQALKMSDYDTQGCMSREKCDELNSEEKDTCFCCDKNANLNNQTSDSCCYYTSKLCDGVSNCKDRSDEIEKCPIRKLYYSSRYYDNKYKCLRHQYNLINFGKNVVGKNFSNEKLDDDFCLKKLIKSSSYSVKIFVLRLLTLLSFYICIIFTVLCFLSLIFVSCCNNLNSSKRNKKTLKNSEDFNYALATDEEYDNVSVTNRVKCCKCNCILCPFVFYSFFAFFAFLFCLIGLCIYLYSLCYVRNAYLVYDFEFIPEHITQAYQYNPWLFDIQRFGISFYSLIVSFSLYLIVFILSTCISCRIQLSPGWKNRNTNSYEVLQMQDIVLNENGKTYGSKSYYKKISKENKNNEKEAKKLGKKYKNKEAKNEDGFSLSEESQVLTVPKARLATMEDSYD